MYSATERKALTFCLVKGTIPEGTDSVLKGAASRTLKLVILEGELFDGYVPKAAQKNENGLYDLDEVLIHTRQIVFRDESNHDKY